MTGFARLDGAADGYSWAWEVKSVNARGLDLRFRLPPMLDGLEAAARTAAGKKFSRGNLSVNLTLHRPDLPPRIDINRDVLDSVLKLVQEYRGDAAPDIETLLSVRGVIEVSEEEGDDADLAERRQSAIYSDFERLLDALGAAREEEGARLEAIVTNHLDRIDALTADAANLASMQPEKRSGRFREQIAELLGDEAAVSEERLAQEIALIVARGDVREELDRLTAHVDSARELIDEGGAVGRRLDFLCQELNREANTLCSKSSDLELTRIGLDLKASIERFREQIQNVE
ncbi:MAG: YicC/YloC family endoribonuclease [Alphaproteobacteria bacterium]